jgi:hypothetical protein
VLVLFQDRPLPIHFFSIYIRDIVGGRGRGIEGGSFRGQVRVGPGDRFLVLQVRLLGFEVVKDIVVQIRLCQLLIF